MKGQKEFVARLSDGLGLTAVLRTMPRRNVLLVVNYHRIGNAHEESYDPGVFSATAEQFDDQIGYLKRHFHMATTEEAVAMVNQETPLRSSVLVTFDDGYLDNYTLAFPVLRSHGVQGLFFLPTAYIGTAFLPFWDVIAYVVRQTKKKAITLTYPQSLTFDLEREGVDRALMMILRMSKKLTAPELENYIAELQRACGTSLPPENKTRRFMNWDEAREMHKGGMAIGSHTHNHEILSKLPVEKQSEELRESRRILEQQLAARIETMSYPNGGRWAFTPATVDALKQNGYRAAFSFYGGMNRPGDLEPFDIRRCSIDRPSAPRFRFQTALAAATGSRWF